MNIKSIIPVAIKTVDFATVYNKMKNRERIRFACIENQQKDYHFLIMIGSYHGNVKLHLVKIKQEQFKMSYSLDNYMILDKDLMHQNRL